MSPELLGQLGLKQGRPGTSNHLLLLPDETYLDAVWFDPHYVMANDATIVVPGSQFLSHEDFELSAVGIKVHCPDAELILAAPSGIHRQPIVEIAKRLSLGVGFPVDGVLRVRPYIEEYNSVKVTDMTNVQPMPVSWLWRNRIARGKITVVAGQPGLGKSQITCSIAAIVSTGAKWPCSSEHAPKGNVVFISAEDDVADTVMPRLIASDADTSRVYRIENKVTGEGGDSLGMLDLAKNIDNIERVIQYEIGGAVLLVIDPVSAYLGSTDQNNNGDIRSALFPIAEMAQRLNIAVLLVSHLNKKTGMDAMSRVTGSGGLVAAARALYVVSKNPRDPDGNRLFLVAKNNIGIDNGGFEYSIEGKEIEGGIETSRIHWHQEATADADDVMAATNSPSHSRMDRARELIQAEMNDRDTIPASRMNDLAEREAITKSTLNRARCNLGISSRKEGDLWVWHRTRKPATKPSQPDD